MAKINTREILNFLNNGLSYHNGLSRQKIVKAGEATITNTTGLTINHGLDGFIPMVKVHAEQLSGEITIPVLVASFTTYHSRYFTVPNFSYYVTPTTVVFEPLSYGTTLKIYYRIYAL